MNAVTAIAAPEAPANVETEAALLGGLMYANNHIDRIADRLKPDDFFEAMHGRIYAALIREHSLGRPVTPVTLKPYFTDDEPMKEVGGPSYLARIMQGAAVVGIDGFAEQINELAKRRRLIEGLTAAIADARDYERTSDEIAAGIEATLAESLGDEGGRSEMSAGDCVGAALAAIERRDPGVKSSIGAIDLAMGPIRKQNLAILAARPGMGKTLVALSYAKEAARAGHGVLFVSLEMSAEELGERLVADEAFDESAGFGVPYDAIVNGQLDRNQMGELVRARDTIAKLPLQVIDLGALKIGGLATLVRRWKRRFAAKGQSLDLVVVDYLQLLAPDYRVGGQYEAITIISKGLKSIAKTNDLGVMALAQLSRKVEERHDKRPMLADLRDSGQIEQDADAVLFLMREEYYLRKSEPHPHSAEREKWEGLMREAQGRIDFICAKRRKGQERTTQGRFFGAYQAVRG